VSRSLLIAALAVSLSLATVARAQPEPENQPAPETVPAPPPGPERGPVIDGYLQPQLSARYRPESRPRDRWELGARPAVGALVSGQPFPMWAYRAHVVVGGALLDSGDPDATVSPSEPLRVAVEIEEAVVVFLPLPWLAIETGHLRVPLTVEQQIATTALMFPNRSAPSEAFLGGTRAGTLVRVARGPLRLSAGGFYDRQELTGARERGVLVALRADLAPLGPMPLAEDDVERGPLRFAVGAGAAYLPTRRFDDSGEASVPVRDLRAAASARLAWRGLYVQTEVLRRQRTDGLTGRPAIATGAYAAVSQYLRLGGFGLAPMARLGWTAADQSFDPQQTVSLEAGVTLYPRADLPEPRDLRLIIQYQGELRRSEGEAAHGALGQLHLRW
jgi:hypothetical protein